MFTPVGNCTWVGGQPSLQLSTSYPLGHSVPYISVNPLAKLAKKGNSLSDISIYRVQITVVSVLKQTRLVFNFISSHYVPTNIVCTWPTYMYICTCYHHSQP